MKTKEFIIKNYLLDVLAPDCKPRRFIVETLVTALLIATIIAIIN